jgi:hypothetical protein
MAVKRFVEATPKRPNPAEQALPAPIAVSPEDLAQVAAGAAELVVASVRGSGGTIGRQAPAV